MKVYEIILIGVALAMDACALTISNCTTYKKSLNPKKEWGMPIAFALFQGIMPLIGFYIGYAFSNIIGDVAKYLTCFIFFVLAGKIIFDLVKEKTEEKTISGQCKEEKVCEFTVAILLVQALATSIDALAVGVTLINLTFSHFIAIGIIAGVTFILVSLALLFGKYLGKLFGEYAEWIGATLLLFLAIKSLVEVIA